MNQAPQLFWRKLTIVLTAKRVWLPLVLGGGLTLVSGGGGPAFIAGLAGVVIGLATATWQLTWGSERLRASAIKQVRSENMRAHHASLRRLQRHLRTDRDPRTGQMLRRLRECYDRMQQLLVSEPATPAWRREVFQPTRQLYEAAYRSLDKSYDLWVAAQKMTSSELREDVLRQRTELLAQVDVSLEHLGRSMDQIQASSVLTEIPADDLTQLQRELEDGLAVARRVEQRMQELESDGRRRLAE